MTGVGICAVGGVLREDALFRAFFLAARFDKVSPFAARFDKAEMLQGVFDKTVLFDIEV
jgi:hypothetical protein